MAEWLRSGLQIRGHRFESGRRLHWPLKKKDQPVAMPNTVNKDYVLNIIKKIDHPRNSDIIKMIEDINISHQKVKIIVSSIRTQFEAISLHHHGDTIWKTTEPKMTIKTKSTTNIFRD